MKNENYSAPDTRGSLPAGAVFIHRIHNYRLENTQPKYFKRRSVCFPSPVFYRLLTLYFGNTFKISKRTSECSKTMPSASFSGPWMKSDWMDVQWKGGNRCGSWRLDSCQGCFHGQLCSQSGDTPAATASTDCLSHYSPPRSKNLLNAGLVRMINWHFAHIYPYLLQSMGTNDNGLANWKVS